MTATEFYKSKSSQVTTNFRCAMIWLDIEIEYEYSTQFTVIAHWLVTENISWNIVMCSYVIFVSFLATRYRRICYFSIDFVIIIIDSVH